MTRYLSTQPELDPFELTWPSEWGPSLTHADIIAAWSESLDLPLRARTIWEAAEIVANDPRYAVYLGCGEPFVEIFRKADLPADTEYEDA